MKSLLCYEPTEVGGSFYYRAMSPLTTLQNYKPNFQTRITGDEETDIAFFWCPRTDAEFTAIARFAKRKVPVVLDFDDNVFDLPADLPAKQFFTPQVLLKIKDAITLSSAVLCSTLGLAKEMLWTGGKLHVVENAHDFELFPYQPLPRQQKLILWRGAHGHDRDFATILPELLLLLNDMPEYRVIFAGTAPDGAKYIKEENKITIPFGHIVDYMRGVQALSPPIMIVPLAQNDHNRLKSNCAWLEGTYFGSAVLAPKLPEFEQPGVTTYDDAQDFYRRLEWMMRRKGNERHVRDARSAIKDKFNVFDLAARREVIFNALL